MSKNCAVLDPPYVRDAGNLKVESFYHNATTTPRHSHRDIIEGYRRGMKEAARILKRGGTLWVKTQDEIVTGRQKRSSIEVFHLAHEIGLLDQDLFILMQEGTPPIQHRDQQHARKNHIYLWVSRKPLRAERQRLVI